jgi:CorA-like Mg2+ transporter protein
MSGSVDPSLEQAHAASSPGDRVAGPRVSARVLDDQDWHDISTDEAIELISTGRGRVWVDVLATPSNATDELRRFTETCPQLSGVSCDHATKGGDYPPRFPPKAKAFEQAIFARGYWLAATDSVDKIRAQEVHILAGSSFAITIRYPTRTWDMRERQQAGERHERQEGLRVRDAPTQTSASPVSDEETETVEGAVVALRDRHRRSRPREGADVADYFGLEVTLAVFDQIIDSVFDALNAIRLIADDLEMSVLQEATGDEYTLGAGADRVPQQTLSIRRLLRQVRWSFLPADEIDELRWGPFIDVDDKGIQLQLDDLSREADRAIDTVRDVIEQVQHVVELSNTLKTERLDTAIHFLTIGATVLLVPGLLAGIWGMNFDDVPGAGVGGGFWIAVVILVTLALVVGYTLPHYLATRRVRRSKSVDR